MALSGSSFLLLGIVIFGALCLVVYHFRRTMSNSCSRQQINLDQPSLASLKYCWPTIVPFLITKNFSAVELAQFINAAMAPPHWWHCPSRQRSRPASWQRLKPLEFNAKQTSDYVTGSNDSLLGARNPTALVAQGFAKLVDWTDNPATPSDCWLLSSTSKDYSTSADTWLPQEILRCIRNGFRHLWLVG